MINITEDSFTIYDNDNNEILHWVIDEVAEDPTVAFVMLNALKLYYESGIDNLKNITRSDLIGR